MKLLIIILIILIVIICLWFAWGYVSSRVEQPAYTLIKTISDDIQIREMPAHIVASVTVNSRESQAPRAAFGILAGYIFGGNTDRGSIAMTAPVTSQASSQTIAMTAPVTSQQTNDTSYEVSFTMPAAYTLDTLPLPNDDRIRIHTVPTQTIAVVRFARYATQSNIDQYREKLLAGLAAAGISTIGTSTLAQYNDPRTPPTMRTNEIWIQVSNI